MIITKESENPIVYRDISDTVKHRIRDITTNLERREPVRDESVPLLVGGQVGQKGNGNDARNVSGCYRDDPHCTRHTVSDSQCQHNERHATVIELHAYPAKTSCESFRDVLCIFAENAHPAMSRVVICTPEDTASRRVDCNVVNPKPCNKPCERPYIYANKG